MCRVYHLIRLKKYDAARRVSEKEITAA